MQWNPRDGGVVVDAAAEQPPAEQARVEEAPAEEAPAGQARADGLINRDAELERIRDLDAWEAQLVEKDRELKIIAAQLAEKERDLARRERNLVKHEEDAIAHDLAGLLVASPRQPGRKDHAARSRSPQPGSSQIDDIGRIESWKNVPSSGYVMAKVGKYHFWPAKITGKGPNFLRIRFLPLESQATRNDTFKITVLKNLKTVSQELVETIGQYYEGAEKIKYDTVVASLSGFEN